MCTFPSLMSADTLRFTKYPHGNWLSQRDKSIESFWFPKNLNFKFNKNWYNHFGPSFVLTLRLWTIECRWHFSFSAHWKFLIWHWIRMALFARCSKHWTSFDRLVAFLVSNWCTCKSFVCRLDYMRESVVAMVAMVAMVGGGCMRSKWQNKFSVIYKRPNGT